MTSKNQAGWRYIQPGRRDDMFTGNLRVFGHVTLSLTGNKAAAPVIFQSRRRTIHSCVSGGQTDVLN